MDYLKFVLISALVEGLSCYYLSVITLYFLSISAICSYALCKLYPFIVKTIQTYPISTGVIVGLFLGVKQLRNTVKNFCFKIFFFPIFDWYIQNLAEDIIKREEKMMEEKIDFKNISPEIRRMLSQK